MVFFVCVGGGPWPLAISAAVTVASLFFNGAPWLAFEWGSDDSYYRMGQRSSQNPHNFHYSRRHTQARPRSVPAASVLGSTVLWACKALVPISILVVAVCCLILWHPALAHHWTAAWLRRIRATLQRRCTSFVTALHEGIDGFVRHADNNSDRRQRATEAHVQALPQETFVSEAELMQWSAGRLKSELQRLQRFAEIRLGFSGGSATREVNHQLRSGVALQKAELVSAVLHARGGESGMSCVVCLASYESGDLLRILPCGHRFHCGCVDRWLTKQSSTCPLCSKRV